MPEWSDAVPFSIVRGARVDRLSELEVFLAVVETGGFTAAARRTGTSQPAVSKAIGTLEERRGDSGLHVKGKEGAEA